MSEMTTSFGVLSATIVNVGTRPVDIRSAGLDMRIRAQKIRLQRFRLQINRSTPVFVPTAGPKDSRDLPQFLSDGEAATCRWSLIKAPFKEYEPRRVFVVDVAGKYYRFKIPRQVRLEANRQTGKVQRRVGPLLGGAIAEMTTEAVEEGTAAFMDNAVIHLDDEETQRRLELMFLFSRIEKELREASHDFSKPMKVTVGFLFSSKALACEALKICQSQPEVKDLTTNCRKAGSDGKWIVEMSGDVVADEPTVALLMEGMRGIAKETDSLEHIVSFNAYNHSSEPRHETSTEPPGK